MINDAQDRARRMRAVEDDVFRRREFVTKRNGKWYAGTLSSWKTDPLMHPVFVVAQEHPTWAIAMAHARGRAREREIARTTGLHPGQPRTHTFTGSWQHWATWTGA